MQTKPVIALEDDRLIFIDQTVLPLSEVYIVTEDYRVVIEAIKKLRIRGAPLIGVAAGYGAYLAASEFVSLPDVEFSQRLTAAIDEIAASRPTAYNLFWALDQCRASVAQGGSPAETVQRLKALALAIHRDDEEKCRRMGEYGEPLIPAKAAIITHCNTGRLATGGIGTAFGVLLTAHRSGKELFVYADETRPLLQGARLTMWELLREGIPSALITDSMAASIMSGKKIDLVITGADRIAANGDSANKIGTYGLAIAAKHHGVPFYIAAPVSTIDPSIPSGSHIPIEQRDGTETAEFAGIRTAPEGIEALSPAFDVVPAELIAGIITDKGVLRPPYEKAISSLM